MPIPLGAEPNGYRILLLIQLSPYGLYQITGQNQAEFADKRLSLSDIDWELYRSLHQVFVMPKTTTGLVNACENIIPAYAKTGRFGRAL